MQQKSDSAAPGKDKIHILYVNPFSSEISGPDESLLTVLEVMPKENFLCSVVIPPGSPYLERYRKSAAHVRQMPLDRLRRSLNPFFFLLNGYRILKTALILRQLIKAQQIDLVHTNMEVTLGSGLAARLAGVRSIYHYRGNAEQRRTIFFSLLFSLLNLLSDKVLVISKATAEVFRGHTLNKKVMVLHNAMNVAKFQRTPALDLKTEFNLEPGHKVVGTVGRLHPRKRIDLFLDIAAKVRSQYKDVSFLIVGDATAPEELTYKEEMQQRIQKLGLQAQVTISGVRNDVPALLKGLDLFMLCSEREGFGRVVVEAQAAGIPVVASNSGGIREIVDNERTGFLVETGASEPFAEAVLCILKDRQLADKMGAAGRQRAESLFSADETCAKITVLYQSMLSR